MGMYMRGNTLKGISQHLIENLLTVPLSPYS
jgi:hypothetical protein